MRILNLIQCTNLGGTESASLTLMRGLITRGHSVRVLSLNPIGQLGPLLDEAGIQYEGLQYRGKGGWRGFFNLRRKIHGAQADALIMTGQNLLGAIALGDFCKGRRILAIHFHHTGVKPEWQWRLIYSKAHKLFNAVTFPCDFTRKEAEAIYPPIAQISRTVRNPLVIPSLPSPKDKALARASYGIPSDRIVIGNAGWLIARKRFDVFLRVAQRVVQLNPKAIFVIAGDGAERSALESLACELGVSRHVRWLGWQKDMSAFYKTVDFLLFNSDWDALGLTPLEAMSYGIPVVCSVRHGGLAEVITSDHYGLLRPTHDVNELANLLLRLLADPAAASVLGSGGRQRVADIGKIDPIVAWHEDILSGKNGC